MGSVIKATGICTDQDSFSSVEHAVAAGRACIETAGIDRNDIDLLINVGIYRDENIGEPAMSALIQKGLGLKTDYVRNQKAKALFSADLMNGSCGLLNAIQVADAFLKLGKCRYAMIVSSDTHPSKNRAPDFPFSCVGAALLLEHSDDPSKGFTHLSFRNSDTMEHSLKGYIDLDKRDVEATGRITVDVPDQYHEKLLELTCSTVNAYLSENQIPKAGVKLVSSQIHAGFGRSVAQACGLDDSAVPDLYSEYGDAHTSALCMAYHLGAGQGLYQSNDRVLFVAAGAGLSVACAMYSV